MASSCILVLLWAGLWRLHAGMAFGVLLGLPVAWILSRPLAPYLTGMQDIPLWLPPLPFAIVALSLLVLGALSWFRASAAPESAQPPEDPEPQ
ncbi:hypothetical protein [Candidatus Rariloculus sp.]|uniref:hypothetical protein n=1 Tax=Candidatus Rariloculus sp. TaxID=3101265 RepID=UPI003D128AA8